MSYDGKDVYVTRFISPDTGGEVVKVDAASMKVATRIVLALDTTTVDGDQKARGVPNFLFSIGADARRPAGLDPRQEGQHPARQAPRRQ